MEGLRNAHINDTYRGQRLSVVITHAIEALLEKQARENPQALTLEQLRERDGKPVYCVDGVVNRCWCIVNANNEDCIDNEAGAWQFAFYNMRGDDGMYGLHRQLGWLAYDYPPKGADR
jgi:hypothetical protein